MEPTPGWSDLSMRSTSITYHLCSWIWHQWPESKHVSGHLGHWWLWAGSPYPSRWLAETALEYHRKNYPASNVFLMKKVKTEELGPVK